MSITSKRHRAILTLLNSLEDWDDDSIGYLAEELLAEDASPSAIELPDDAHDSGGVDPLDITRIVGQLKRMPGWWVANLADTLEKRGEPEPARDAGTFKLAEYQHAG